MTDKRNVSDEIEEDRYIICKHCEGHEDGWSILVDRRNSYGVP